MAKNKLPPCGNLDCSCSTGIHEGLTFGRGYLNTLGFFKIPCRICAADHDASVSDTRERIRKERLAAGDKPEEVEQYLRDAEWLNLPAWPYKDT